MKRKIIGCLTVDIEIGYYHKEYQKNMILN